MKGKYNNLQAYLEAVFQGQPPTKEQIAQAKKKWRKNYLVEYRQEYVKQNIQISFRLSKKQYDILKREAEERGVKITSYAKEKTLSETKSPDTTALKTLVLELMDSIEESGYENTPLNPQYLLEQLEEVASRL